MMIDTHCHLLESDYENFNDVINHMKDNIMIASGADNNYNKDVVKIINKYNNIYGTIGLHPDEADTYQESDIKFIEYNIENPKIVGIGEIGLDYSRDGYSKDNQIKLFKTQLDLARKYNKPVVIHSRDAIMDTFNIIKDYSDLKMVLHCYSSSVEMAKEFMKLGVKFGIGGVVTFKNGKKLQEVVKEIPLDYLLLETDSPYLSPEPYRGKQNEPCNISLVAKKIAEIKGIDIEEVYKKTTQNAINVYNIKM